MQKPETSIEDGYNAYLQEEIALFARRSPSERATLDEAFAGVEISRVLDVGCGAGQEMLPFAEMTTAVCVGLDASPHVGEVGRALFLGKGYGDRVVFVRGVGESLPFGDASFDLVICRLALPYMDNRASIAEMARVLSPGGRLILKIHAPRFYLAMLRSRLPSLSLKQWVYPFLCMLGGTWFWVTGHQPRSGIWKGKEVFQTQGMLREQLGKNNLRICGETPGSNRQTPSFLIIKY